MTEPVLLRLRGVAEMLAMRPGWRTRFDVSPSAFARSFLAMIPAAPLFVLSMYGQNTVARALAPESAALQTINVAQSAILFVCMWAYFPLVARLFTRVLKLEDSFAPWVIVHNWTALLILGVQGVPGALLLAGLLSPTAYVQLDGIYFIFAIYAHCRAAIGSMNAPAPVALGGATVAVLVWLIVQLLLVYAFSGGMLQVLSQG